MSMALCEVCECLVDTDEDCDAFVEVPSNKPYSNYKCVCEYCRERHCDDEGKWIET